jgi:hypothetical protein
MRSPAVDDPISPLLLDVTSSAKMLGCSRDHLMSLINDGEIEFVDIARTGSRHREPRLTVLSLKAYVSRRTCRMVQKAATAPKHNTWHADNVLRKKVASFEERFRQRQAQK